MPAFVILQHEMPSDHERASHWDFMLQVDDHLRTWALDEQPADGTTLNATQLADHRLEYLEYEGPISADRGRVTQWDRGSYLLIAKDQRSCEVELRGRRLVGRVSLRQVQDQRWLFSFTGVAEAT